MSAIVAAGVVGAQVRETDVGVVVLIGDRAYKLKKPVNTDLLDLLGWRLPCCRTTSPDRVVVVRRSAGVCRPRRAAMWCPRLRLEFIMARPRSAGDGDVLVRRLSALRTRLEQQRRFRREQLAQLDADDGTHDQSAYADLLDPADPEAVSALREVDAVVSEGARRALADIELALVRMATGRYGRCRSCEADIPLVVLEAIPKTTLCLKCAWRSEVSDAGEPRPPRAPTSRSPLRREPAGPQRRSRRAVDPARVTPVSGAVGQVV